MALLPQIEERTKAGSLPSGHHEVLPIANSQIELWHWPGAAILLPIVLLHEALGSAMLWLDFPASLSRSTGRTVIAWSRAGHGTSSAMPETTGFDYLQREVDQIPAILAALRCDRAHFYGHSDGATIALMTALAFPWLAASLILEAPHVLVEDVTIAGIAATRQLYLTGALRQKLSRHHLDPDPIFQRWTDVWLAPQFRDWSIADKLPNITAPTLLIQGIDDQYASMAQIDDICAAIPRCQRIAVPSCGHVPHREQAAVVLSAAAKFVAPQA